MPNPDRKQMAVVLTPLMQRAAELRGTLAEREPSDAVRTGGEAGVVEMLGLGASLGLWRYLTIDSAGQYHLEVNDHRLVLRAAEVGPWVLGICEATGLELGPFTYRDGLEVA